MKKCCVVVMCLLIVAGMCSCSWGDVPIDAAHFPDEVFREHVREYDTDGNNTLSDAELASVSSIDVSGSSAEPGSITSLKGIEHFTTLMFLNCSYNRLADLDVRTNKALTELMCTGNHLAVLNIGENTALEKLNCGINSLTALDVSKNIALEYLECSKNALTALDVSKNTALKTLYCWGNQLTAFGYHSQHAAGESELLTKSHHRT